MDDLRDWLEKADKMGQLKKVDGADWDLEIGCLTYLNHKKVKDCPPLLFDNIKSYPTGYRVLTCSTSNPKTVSLTFDLPITNSPLELTTTLRKKMPQWEANVEKFSPKTISKAPLLENIHSGKDIDLFEFPVPKWNELDGGRYIGTGDVVVTRDPDTGEVNLGTYRIMVHDRQTTALYISPGKHGRLNYEKYHARGERCPVAVSFGNHPLIFRIAGFPVKKNEYKYIGAIREEPVNVITEEITGLPVPADSELVIAGWCPPGKTKEEGPFGEAPGYYASKVRGAPVIEVERIYHRDNPIIVGSPPAIPPSDCTYCIHIMQSSLAHNDLEKFGVPEIRGVWQHHTAGARFTVVSVKQMYGGHAKQAAVVALQSPAVAYLGRYVVVVDEDIDPTDINQVIWAIATRSDPKESIDIIRRTWSSALDPRIPKPATAYLDSRAIIDACKPFEWIDEFPAAVEHNPELVERVSNKWKDLF